MIDNPISDLISKDLRRWFKEKWVDVSRKDKDGKHPPCGRSDAKLDSKGYPKCRPSKKVSEDTPTTTRGISAEEKKKMTRRKRSKPQGVGGKPTMVKSIFDNISPEQARAIAFSMNSPFDYMEQGEIEIPEVKTEETGRDPCCQEAFNAQLATNNARPEWMIQDYADRYMNGDFCAALRYLLESSVERAHEWLTTPLEERRREMERDAAYQIKRGEPVVSVEEMNEEYQRQYDQHKKVLDGWDACSATKLPDDGMFTASANPFETAWDSIVKGKFRGYTQSNISDRPYRQAEHRVWDVSRRNKKAKTRRRYARQLSRGNFRPEMRRQLGAGGKRASTKR
jgi:hypothetical protein